MSKNSLLGWAAAAVGFLILLAALTVFMAPPAPPSGAAHNADGAEAACTERVLAKAPGSRFPFSANVSYLGDARYRLNGTVETTMAGAMVRRNYECVIRYTQTGAYVADTVTVWRSH